MSAMLFLFNETFSMTSYDDVPVCTISYMIIELWRPPPTHGGWLVLIPIIESRMLFSSHKVQHNPSQAREQLCNGAEQVAAGALSLSIYTRYIYTIVQAGCLYSTFSLLSRFWSTFKKHPIFLYLSNITIGTAALFCYSYFLCIINVHITGTDLTSYCDHYCWQM